MPEPRPFGIRFPNVGPRRLGFVGTEGESILDSLLSKFSGGNEVAVRYDLTGANNTLYVSQDLGSNRVWTTELYTPETLSAGNEWMSIRRQRIDKLYGGYNTQSTPAVTLNGAGWNDSAGTHPGGRLMYNATATRTATFTTPSGSTAIGVISNAAATNLGLALVTIDSDNTLATSLPTAQDLVTAGTFPDTILIANGGTLNPTDRVWDGYQLTNNYAGGPTFNTYNYTLFVEGLTAGAHTVTITVTGYKRAASSTATVLFYMIITYGDGIHTFASLTPTASTSRVALIPVQDIYDITSTFPRNEISYNTKPTGASAYEWVGHTASLKFNTGGTPTLAVDGSAKTLTDNDVYVGSTVVVTEQLRVRHTEIGGGATEVGVLDLTYTFNKSTGLTIAHTLNWSMGGVAVGYPCLLAVEHSVLDRFQTLGSGLTAADLTANDDSVNFSTAQQAGYAWDADGYIGAMMYIPSLANTVENWAKSTNKLAWFDISTSGGAWKKLYAQRFASDETFTDASVWTSEANYRAMWFENGANGNLA